jgi:hypothetical protein
MNIVDALALLVTAASHISTLAGIIQKARAEGREELTPEEIAQVRAIAIAAEGRAEAAVA